MKIGIDARFVGPQGTGLGKYTEKLIENLAKIDHHNQYLIFLRKDNWDWQKLPNNFKKIPADVPWYSLAEQIKLPKIFASQNLDLLHVPHFNVPILYRRKFIVTIHDLIHHQFAESSTTTRNPLFFKIKRFGYRKVIDHTIKNSQRIIVPSNFVKNEIIRTFRVNPDKVIVTYEAAEEEYFQSRNKNKPGLDELQTGFGGGEGSYLIYVGNAYPHKNLERLLNAVSIIAKQHSRSELLSSPKTHSGSESKLKLVIVCPRDIFWKRVQSEIKQRQLEDSVELKGYMEPQELTKLFQKATAYVFPSLSEGFGIPGLNAMASGLPVVCSNIPTLKEVYGDAALYFDPHNPKDIAEKIHQVISDDKIRSDLVKKGKSQVQKYSWRRMAQETLGIYKAALSSNPNV